ncbi:DUF4870 domain-containing protein [Isoptericola sp. BMS4]|uniref:DUF4870 domain-containing protein n=1 Tax=Isoptericola sp. BMS4 TaxID=2527875 RepID=UPI001423F21E|nr:DUF4870 domain-containing protein [Isoptericola sp. BMS4]
MSDTTPSPEDPQQPQGQQPASPQQPQQPPYPQQPQGQQPYGQPYAPQPPVSPSDERTWSIIAHVGGIVTGFLAPLIIWLVYKDRSPRLDDQGKQALNFQLTVLIAYVVGGILTVILIGGLIAFAAWVCAIVFGIMGAVASSRDEWYRYPIAIPFIK